MLSLYFPCGKCRRHFLESIASDSKEVRCPHCGDVVSFPNLPLGEARWMVVREHARFGPFSLEQLRELARGKQLSPGDTVWRQDSPPRDGDAADNSVGLPGKSARKTSQMELTASAEGVCAFKACAVRRKLTIALEDFQLLRKLGSGGMGEVFLAWQRSQARQVALKILAKKLADQDVYVERFYREARMLAALNHPSIVSYHGVGEKMGRPFFAMEFVEGPSSADIVKHKGKLDVGDALFIILHCVDALSYVHDQHVVDRDIKPQNILVTQLGRVKIADLGLAKSVVEPLDLTESGMTLGSPRFMAPEQARNAKHADHRSDIYSLGAVLYFYLTGQAPFEGETAMELMLAKERGQFPPARRLNAEVPCRLELAIDKMLAREPHRRYQSYADLKRDLENLGLAHEHLSVDVLPVVPGNDPSLVPSCVHILMVDEDPNNVLLAEEALDEKHIAGNISVVKDAQAGLAFLSRCQDAQANAPACQLLILGPNLQAPACLSLLQAMKASDTLRVIPVVVLAGPADMARFLEDHGFPVRLVVKGPDDLRQFGEFVQSACDLSVTVAQA